MWHILRLYAETTAYVTYHSQISEILNFIFLKFLYNSFIIKNLILFKIKGK